MFQRPVIPVILAAALASGAATASSSSLFQYVSPRPGARFVPPGTTIILRPAANAARSIGWFHTVEVVGSTSGLHPGELISAEQGRTFIFRPHDRFEPGESVSVTVAGGPGGSHQQKLEFTISTTPPHVRSRQVDSCFGGAHKPTSSEPASPLLPTPQGGSTLPDSFPAFTVTIDDDPAPGYVFAGPRPRGPPPGQNFAIMLESTGSPTFFRWLRFPAVDFKKHPSVNLFSYYQGVPNAQFKVVDDSLVLVDGFTPTNGYVHLDQHDFQILPNGHVLVGILDFQIVDMSQIVPGGDPSAIVTGFVLQEQDPAHNVVFQWRSWDHFEITDATGLNFTAPSIDYVHWNASEYDTDGNIMISSRNLNEITKIDRQTGEVLWRMGGSQNEFTLIGDTQWFTRQHAIRRTATGTVVLYDNGNLSTPQESRAAEYELDEVNKVATLVWEFRNDPPRYSPATGNAQRLPNGNTMISWGELGVVSEVRADGTKAFEMLFDTYVTYRAFRFDWTGTAARPELWYHFEPLRVILCFEKFGDPDVQEFRIYRDSTPNPTTLVGTTPDRSFILDDVEPRETLYVRVTAWDGTSESSYSNEHEIVVPAPVGISMPEGSASRLTLSQNRPNPFAAATAIPFTVHRESLVELSVYDVRGRLVRTLSRGPIGAGANEVVWNGTDSRGRRVGAGVYFCRLHSDGVEITRRMTVIH